MRFWSALALLALTLGSVGMAGPLPPVSRLVTPIAPISASGHATPRAAPVAAARPQGPIIVMPPGAVQPKSTNWLEVPGRRNCRRAGERASGQLPAMPVCMVV